MWMVWESCKHAVRRAGVAAVCGTVLGLAAGVAWAGDAPVRVQGKLPQPASAQRVLLTVVSGSKQATWTLAQLEALGLYRVHTDTFWPDDNGTYEGPLLADVLKASGLDGAAKIRVSAKDGFSQLIPSEDWGSWPVILATRRDGVVMSTRNKGPLRVIYPRSMDARLADPVYRLRWVWLVQRIEVVQ